MDLTKISNFLSVVICKGFANNSLLLNREYALILISDENDKSKDNYENFWRNYYRTVSVIFSFLNMKMKQSLYPGQHTNLRIWNTEVIK